MAMLMMAKNGEDANPLKIITAELAGSVGAGFGSATGILLGRLGCSDVML